MASFPLRSFLELGAYDTAPGSARGHARNVLAEWRLGAFEEKAILVVSTHPAPYLPAAPPDLVTRP